MTQEVQPLTWQKRTNLEEHQQFFSKINEIIANLAPTVDEAEAAITQATAAIASANDAVATANAASAAASAAASTVTGYDARLSEAESKNSQQDTAISELQTADTQNVKLNGAQTITGAKKFTQLLTSSSSEWRTNWIVPFYTKSMVLQPSDNAVFLVNDVVQDSQANLVSVDQIVHTNVNTVYRDWQLQTAHGNVDVTLEINANGEKYATAPTPSSNAPSTAIVNKAYVESTDGVTNNLVHRSANETIAGVKTFTDGIIAYPSGWHHVLEAQNAGEYVHFATYNGSPGWNVLLEFMASSNNGCEYGLLGLSNGGDIEPNANDVAWFVRGCGAAPNKVLYQKNLYICHNAGSNEWHLVMYKHDTYGNASYRVKMENGYGNNGSPESKIIAVTPTAVNFDSYTHKYRVSDAIVGSE